MKTASFTLTDSQLAWLDAKRKHGSISRSAALRQVIDQLAALERQQPLASMQQGE